MNNSISKLPEKLSRTVKDWMASREVKDAIKATKLTFLAKIFTVPGDAGRLSAMEGLRAYAVFIVFLVHYASNLGAHFDADPTRFSLAAGAGFKEWFLYYLHASHYGVDMFFLISGYLISGLITKPNFNYFSFLMHRILRIYPAFLVSIILFKIYAILFEGEHFWFGGFLGNMLFLNGIPGHHFPYISIVTWSLFFEFSFYIIIPFLFRRTSAEKLSPPWLLSLLFILIILPLAAINPEYMRYFMFLAGIWLRLLPKSRLEALIKIMPEYGVIALYLFATSFFLLTQNWVIFIPVYILPCFFLVNCIINGSGCLNQVFSLAPLRYLGNISFSFYLSHTLGLKITAGILAAFNITGFTLYATGLFIIGFAISLLLSTLSFWFLERPYFSQKARFDLILQKLRRLPAN